MHVRFGERPCETNDREIARRAWPTQPLDAQYSTASTATVSTPTGTTTAVTNGNGSGGVTEVFIKKLYLEGKFSNAFVLHVGAYTSPWTGLVEGLYGYRFIDKTTTDRLGFANTADWGVNATGVAGDHNRFSYSASVVNGGGYKNPTRTKKVDFEARAAMKPLTWLTVGAGYYNGHLGQITAANDSLPRNTAQRFDFVACVNISGWRVGAEYFSARNYKTVNSFANGVFGTSAIVASGAAVPVSDRAEGFSSWVSYSFNDRWSVFGRYDDAKLSKRVLSRLEDQYFNAGVSYKPIKPLDIAIAYKHERIANGTNTVSGADANGSYTIGGANSTRSGTFEETGVFLQYQF
ncbi:MAG TPA: hypothetical protein VJQ47_06555 [Steroidobacteraceae bacterium]|nr:hypothetical protein [Steroidobacteraceae bacterium]